MLNILKQGHPKGLYLLFFVEMWERFSYYGMRALLVLYMVQQFAFSTQKASFVYGIYTGLVYLTPLIGGYIADRYWGQRKCITAGAILMSLGLFGLAINNYSTFYISLILMICANGMFKSNISTIVGMLYKGDNTKKDSGFTIFYMGINLGALLSPLVCGTLAVKYGFHIGFMSAGAGMVIGLALYKLLENKFLGDCGKNINNTTQEIKNGDSKLSDNDKKNLFTLFILIIFSTIFWLGYEQAGSSLTLFAEYGINRVLGSYTIPTEYFQALNPFFIIILAPLISTFWISLNKKNCEPNSVQKFSLAFLILSIAYVILALAVKHTTDELISPIWLLIYYFIATIAELCISPIGLSLVSKLAPIKFASMIMGVWFLSSFLGNLFAGVFSGFYGKTDDFIFFMILALILLSISVLIIIIMPKLAKIK